MRPIDADALKETIDNIWDGRPISLLGARILATIDHAPTIDADVVRCKDCKYSFYDKDYESYNCRKHEYVECFDANDYCSWGERND